MKTRLEWFVVPCVATMFAGNAITLHAQDAPKAKRILNVVLAKESDDLDAKSIRDKVAKELENSGIAEAVKERILKDVEAALSAATKTAAKEASADAKHAAVIVVKAKEHAKEAAKHAEAAVAKAKQRAKEAAENVDIIIQKNIPKTANQFTTQFFLDPKGESFRIGIQCVQLGDEGSESAAEGKPGLEVNAVFDDSPAKKAGIEEGDVLLTVDATKITKIADLTNALQAAGSKEAEVAIELKRDDKTITLKVKPTKMKSADLELENVRLALPTGGYVVDEQAMKSFQEQMKHFIPAINSKGGSQAWSFNHNSEDLKKDLEDLKSELSELKKMIRELAKAVGEK